MCSLRLDIEENPIIEAFVRFRFDIFAITIPEPVLLARGGGAGFKEAAVAYFIPPGLDEIGLLVIFKACILLWSLVLKNS
jgi:hypothetical protein